MTIEIEDLPELQVKGHKLMGLDLGSKTIGIAFSDIELKIATARETLKRTKFSKDADYLLSLVRQEKVFAIVLGLPLNMDGSEGPRAQSTRSFARNFEKLEFAPPIFFWDERLSTAAVERVLVNDVDMTRKRRAEVVDKMAAAYILQGALDAV